MSVTARTVSVKRTTLRAVQESGILSSCVDANGTVCGPRSSISANPPYHTYDNPHFQRHYCGLQVPLRALSRAAFDTLILRHAHPSTRSSFDTLILRHAHPSTRSG